MKTLIISENTFEKARKKIRENPDKKIIFSGENDELNRKIMEKEKIDTLLISQKERKDFQKQRNSGLNSVLAKIAKKNKIKIGINLDEILNAKQKEKAQIIARIKQNIELCKKNKINMKFIGRKKKDTYDLKSLGLVLGMDTKMTSSFN
jgi:ribonuclease P/MRP protein subunit RPP1